MSDSAHSTVPFLKSSRPVVEPTAALLPGMPGWTTSLSHALIALNAHVDPAPSIGTQDATDGATPMVNALPLRVA